jgi:hypothetical protein
MQTRTTTLVHNGTVYTIGSNRGFASFGNGLAFSATVTIADGDGISYPRIEDGCALTEDGAITNAVANILDADPVHSYAITTDNNTFPHHVRTLDEAFFLVEEEPLGVSITEL